VLRVDLRDYGWKKDTWERLGAFDPYMHTPVQVEQVVERRKKYLKAHTNAWWRRKAAGDEWERCEDGEDEFYTAVDTERKPARALAPWLADPFPGRNTPGDPVREKRLGDLVAATKSESPVLMFEWFFRQTAIQDDDKYDGRAPGYYDFLKMGRRQEDFERQFALDLDTARFVFQAEMFAAERVRPTRGVQGARLRRHRAVPPPAEPPHVLVVGELGRGPPELGAGLHSVRLHGAGHGPPRPHKPVVRAVPR
jgi:hypothetical protein